MPRMSRSSTVCKMPFKRSQIEDAAYELAPGEGRTELSMRLKRLLAGDRLLGRSSTAKDPIKSEFAFFSGKGPGTGADVDFDEFDAFNLFIGLTLVRQGFPQLTVIQTLRRVKAELKRAHRRALAKSFDSLQDLSSSPPPKPGEIARNSSDPVYLAIASESRAAGIQSSKRRCEQSAFARGKTKCGALCTNEPPGRLLPLLNSVWSRTNSIMLCNRLRRGSAANADRHLIQFCFGITVEISEIADTVTDIEH